jgi:competence protein ComEA
MLNLTRQERLVIQFLVVFFLIGTVIHFYKSKMRRSDDTMMKRQTSEARQFQKMSERVDSLYTVGDSTGTTKSPKKTTKKSTSKKKTVIVRPVKVNTASKEELMSLPRIGSVLADSIINYRKRNGKFSTMDDLLKVKGISQKTLDKIKGEVAIE